MLEDIPLQLQPWVEDLRARRPRLLTLLLLESGEDGNDDSWHSSAMGEGRQVKHGRSQAAARASDGCVKSWQAALDPEASTLPQGQQ